MTMFASLFEAQNELIETVNNKKVERKVQI
jgi:hypothetical protein